MGHFSAGYFHPASVCYDKQSDVLRSTHDYLSKLQCSESKRMSSDANDGGLLFKTPTQGHDVERGVPTLTTDMSKVQTAKEEMRYSAAGL